MSKGLWLSSSSNVELNQDEKLKRFRGVSYSGKEITDRLVFADDGQIYGKLVIDVDQAKQQTSRTQVPVFYNHDQSQALGHGKLTFDDKISIEGMFSDFTEKSKEIHGLLTEGFPMQQSVYVQTDQIQGVSSGSVHVNGQEFQAPIAVFRNGFIREVSLCPIAADPRTNTEIFSITNESQENLKARLEQQQKGEKKMDLSKFNFMSDEEKTKYGELLKNDAFAAHEFACSCQEKAKEETKKVEEDEEETKVESEDLKASKKEVELLKNKLADAESKLAEATKSKEETVEVDGSLFERTETKSGNSALKDVLARTKELQEKQGLGFNQAYSKARSEVMNG